MLVPVIQNTTGLNTVDPPHRANAENTFLAAAVNVRISRNGEISIVPGYTKLQDLTNGHSLFCDGGDCFVCQGGSLYQVATDYSLSGVRSGMCGDPVSYATHRDKTYYTNGTENGVIRANVSYVWGKDEYFGPDTTRYFSEPPVGHHLEIARGRMFVAENNVLWWSEPYQFGLFNQATSFVRFKTKIVMVKRVEGGLFVSDSEQTHFLPGSDPAGFSQVTVATYPAYEWSVATGYVDGQVLGLSGKCALWSSPEGAILGSPDGQITNLNKDKVVYPENATAGASLIRGYDFIHTMR
jgi:hypothetical protein